MLNDKQKFWSRHRDTLIYFGIPTILFTGILSFMLLIYQRKELHLMLNQWHNSYSDYFFRYITEIGGGFIIVIAVLLVFFKYRYTGLALTTLLINLIFTNSLKTLFANPRPKYYFAENYPDIALRYVNGVHMYTTYSFPSGHTSTAFALGLVIALSFHHKWVKLISSIMAILVGYSRIYLSQHFADDVLFGAFVGIFSALLTTYIFHKIPCTKTKWMDSHL